MVTLGKVKIKASVLWQGSQMPIYGELVLDTKPSATPLIYDEEILKFLSTQSVEVGQVTPVVIHDKEAKNKKLRRIEKEQSAFGEKR